MPTILDFYRECESKYDHLPIFDLVKDDAERILQYAKPGALSQLKTLFGEDEKLMFYMLQYLLMIPSVIKSHDELVKIQRKPSKSIPQKKKRFLEKIDQRVEGFMSLYRALNPDVDDKTLKDMTIDVFKKDKRILLEADILNETIMNYEKRNTRQGKANTEFKDIIYNTFIMAKGTLDNFARLLNCLNFTTPQGETYTRDNLKHYCKTPSQ